jgi:hypothetical protein
MGVKTTISKDVDWVLDAIMDNRYTPLTKGCVVAHKNGMSNYGQVITPGLYVFDSFEKDNGDKVTAYITKRFGSGKNYYVNVSSLAYVMSKDDAKKYNLDTHDKLNKFFGVDNT